LCLGERCLVDLQFAECRVLRRVAGVRHRRAGDALGSLGSKTGRCSQSTPGSRPRPAAGVTACAPRRPVRQRGRARTPAPSTSQPRRSPGFRVDQSATWTESSNNQRANL
jgi:hypothetical protein